MSRTQSHTSSETESEPSTLEPASSLVISVVVPIRNEEKFIGKTLDGLVGQDYPSDAFEVIVVDGDSTDATRREVKPFAERHPHVHLLSNPKRWASAARNVGVDAAIGDVVIIVDGHCQFLDNQYLKSIERAFKRHDVDCLGRPQPLDVKGGSVLQQAIALARSSRLGHHPDSFIYTDREQTVPAHSVGVAYRKSVFELIGKFDENFDACEDVEFNQRVDDAGLHCVLAPSISLRYYPRSSLRGLFRQMARYGRGRVRLFRKHENTFSLKSLVPACFLAFLLVGLVPAILLPILQLPYLGVIVLYAAVVAGFSVALAIKSRDLRMVLWLPVVFGVIHFGAGNGALQELIFGKSQVDSFDR